MGLDTGQILLAIHELLRLVLEQRCIQRTY